MKLAILDDYLQVALRLADWREVRRRCEVRVFDRPFAGEDDAAEALADVGIIVTLRERTQLAPRAHEAGRHRVRTTP